jgi:hypothetical protein
VSGDEPDAGYADFGDDPWAGMVDESGYPFDVAPAEQAAAADLDAGAVAPSLFNLPEEFWGTRDLFKVIRQQARADGTGPDAVLGAVLARASAMMPHGMKFDSGKIGTFNLFVNAVGPTGVGKTEAMRSAQRIMLPPRYLADPQSGLADMERFRDGVALGSGEGLAEIYMGTIEKDTGEFHRTGPNKGDPKTKPVRAQIRHNAFFFLDEGEALTKMLERKGATVGQALRTAWTGATLGASNAQETTTRFIPDGTYSMGILIGWQPKTAMALIGDAAGGTPQRFLWLSTIDPEMPEDPDSRPEPFTPPLCDHEGRPATGVVEFPREIKRMLRAALRRRHVEGETVDELHSHEPLMRCKVAALLCVLDGRMLVSADDWRLAGMIWSASCAVRDRLVAFGRQQQAREMAARREQLVADAEATESARLRVTDRVVGSAKRIAHKVYKEDESFLKVKRWDYRRNFGSTDKPYFDDALAYAISQGWVLLEDDGGLIGPGTSRPV